MLCLGSVGGQAQNLITNPGFESGVTGYATGYGVNDTTPTVPGQAGVLTTPTSSATVFGSGTTTDQAHSGNNFFAVNGASANGSTTVVWEQTVSSLVIGGLTGSTFTFSFWAAAGNTESTTTGPDQRPSLQLTINGVNTALSASTFIITSTTYAQFTTTWTRGTATSAIIRLFDDNNRATGNDFLLDDFVLVPEPGTYAAGVFLVGAGLLAWRKARQARGRCASGGRRIEPSDPFSAAAPPLP